MKPLETTKQYLNLDNAFQFYNKELFNDKLPPCIITLSESKKFEGYYHAKKFKGKYTKKSADEICLNPQTFDKEEKLILSTLAHEMCHHWQQHFGTISRNGYHNNEWSKKMIEIGLMPSSTGKEGGKTTGQKMADYIIEGEKFDNITDDLLKNKVIEWKTKKYKKTDKESQEKKKKNKIKYTCNSCGINVWGKPGLNVMCGDCNVRFEEIIYNR